MQILGKYTMCGIFCSKCGMIDIMRPRELLPIPCPVCSSNNWVKVKLKIVEKVT